MADEIKHIHVILGPYRDHRLSVTAAEADAAINAHWAIDPHGEYPGHEPLTDQQRSDAVEAAHTWARTTWDTAQGVAPAEPPPVEPPPEGGVSRKREMEPEKGEGYKTRATKL